MLTGKGCVLCLALLALGQQQEETPAHIINHRRFVMPVQIDARALDQLQSLRLFMSRDYGRTWTLLEAIAPPKGKFIFTASEDGTYWFVVQTVAKDGKRTPQDISKTAGVLRVRINTIGRPAPASEPPPPEPAYLGHQPPLQRK
jgi:hypothetical protein